MSKKRSVVTPAVKHQHLLDSAVKFIYEVLWRLWTPTVRVKKPQKKHHIGSLPEHQYQVSIVRGYNGPMLTR